MSLERIVGGTGIVPSLLALSLAFASPSAAGEERLFAFFHRGKDKGEKHVLGKKELSAARSALQDLQGEARLVLFTEEKDCKECGEAETLMREIASCSPKVSLEVLSLSADNSRAEELGVDKVPAVALLGSADTGIRYYGLPLGYEFETFVDAVRCAAEGEPELVPETMDALGRLGKPVTITVFVAET
jgi:alkyl hydroperoxide reductase subunit AhpF